MITKNQNLISKTVTHIQFAQRIDLLLIPIFRHFRVAEVQEDNSTIDISVSAQKWH